MILFVIKDIRFKHLFYNGYDKDNTPYEIYKTLKLILNHNSLDFDLLIPYFIIINSSYYIDKDGFVDIINRLTFSEFI